MSALPTPEALTRTPITTVVDLCLYRGVSDRCRGRIVSVGKRQLIEDYGFVSIDKDTLREAVRLWRDYRASLLQRYDNIND